MAKGGKPLDAFLEGIAADELRIIRCAVYPSRWTQFSQQHGLHWQAVPFTTGGAVAVPEGAGLYCFIVGNSAGGLPQVLFPLYAGETENLRARYRQYLIERNSDRGRKQVRKFLNVFWGEAEFCFAEHAADKQRLREIEKALNDSLLPPYSLRDFSAEVKASRNAWQ
jgi:hypothetical protein